MLEVTITVKQNDREIKLTSEQLIYLISIIDDMLTEAKRDQCECADHQGGPCSFCMEAKHKL